MYKRAGFEAVGTFIQKTNGSCFEFLKMNYICKITKTEESSSVFSLMFLSNCINFQLLACV